MISRLPTPAPHMLDADHYAAGRILAEAIQDERVSVDAVVVLDALADHVAAGQAPRLVAVAEDAQLTPEQLAEALCALDRRGYLQQLAEHAPALSGLRAAVLGKAA